MGGEKTTQQGSTNSTTTVTPTQGMIDLNNMQAQDYAANRGAANQATQSGLGLANQLLTGQQLPGYLQSLPGGIGEPQTQSMVDQSLRDLNVQMAKSGAGSFLESGASQAMGVRAAADIRNQNAQFNSQNLQQLINLATGSAAVPLGYTSTGTGQLGSRLSGLSSTSTNGSYSGSTIGINPFMKSFQTQLGQNFGNLFNPQKSSSGFTQNFY